MAHIDTYEKTSTKIVSLVEWACFVASHVYGVNVKNVNVNVNKLFGFFMFNFNLTRYTHHIMLRNMHIINNAHAYFIISYHPRYYMHALRSRVKLICTFEPTVFPQLQHVKYYYENINTYKIKWLVGYLNISFIWAGVKYISCSYLKA